MKEGSRCYDKATVIKINHEDNNLVLGTTNSSMKWTSNIKIYKYNTKESYDSGIPDEVQEVKGNTATYKGIFVLWCLAQGLNNSSTVTFNGTTFTGIYPFNQSNTFIGVGNGATDASPTDSSLLGDNTTYKGCDTGYPIIDPSDPTTLQVRSTFGQSDGNHDWNEWGIFNGDPGNITNPRNVDNVVMFNRKVESMGTKAPNSTWVIVANIVISPN